MQSSQLQKVDLPSTSGPPVRNKKLPSWAKDLDIFPLDFFTTNRLHIIRSTNSYVRELSQWRSARKYRDLQKLKAVLRRLVMFLHAFAAYIDSKMQLEPEMEEHLISLVSLYINFELRYLKSLKKESMKKEANTTTTSTTTTLGGNQAQVTPVTVNNKSDELTLGDGPIDEGTVIRYREMLVERISHWIYILLPSHEQRVDALLSNTFYTKLTRPVLDPIFRKVLSEMPYGPFSSVSYVRHMLAFKTWREQCLVNEDPESRALYAYVERHLKPLDFKSFPKRLLRCLGKGTTFQEHARPYTVILTDECRHFINYCRDVPAAADHINLESISEGISLLDDDNLYEEENEISKLMTMISNRKMRRLAAEQQTQTILQEDVIDLTETSPPRPPPINKKRLMIEPCDVIDLTEDDFKTTFRKNNVRNFSIRTDLFSPSTTSSFHDWRYAASTAKGIEGRQPLELNPAPPPSPAPPTPSRVHTLAILAEKGAASQQQLQLQQQQQQQQSRVTNLDVEQSLSAATVTATAEQKYQCFKSVQVNVNDLEDEQAPIHRTHCRPYHHREDKGMTTCNNTPPSSDDRKPLEFCDNAIAANVNASRDLNRTCTTTTTTTTTTTELSSDDNCVQTNNVVGVECAQTNDSCAAAVDDEVSARATYTELVISDVTSIAIETTATTSPDCLQENEDSEETINREHTPHTLDKRKSSIDDSDLITEQPHQQSNDEILQLCNELDVITSENDDEVNVQQENVACDETTVEETYISEETLEVQDEIPSPPFEAFSEPLQVQEIASELLKVQANVSESLQVQQIASKPLKVQENASEPLKVQANVSESLQVQQIASEPLEVQENASEPLNVQENVSESLQVQQIASEPLEVQTITSEPLEVQEFATQSLEVQEFAPQSSEVHQVPCEPLNVQEVPSETVEVPSEHLEVPSEHLEVPFEPKDVPSESLEVPSEPLEVQEVLVEVVEEEPIITTAAEVPITTEVEITQIERTDVATTEDQTAELETAKVETTEVETTQLETEVETAELETAKVETTEVETTQLETEVEATNAETTEVETNEVETSQIETPQIETAEVETTVVETTQTEVATIQKQDETQISIVPEETPITNIPEQQQPELTPVIKPRKNRVRRTETSLLQNARSNRKRKNVDKEESPGKRKRTSRKPEETPNNSQFTIEESTNKENLKTDETKTNTTTTATTTTTTTQRKVRRKQLELLLDCDRKDQLDLDNCQDDVPTIRKGRRKIEKVIETPPEIEHKEVVVTPVTKRGRKKSTELVEIVSPQILESDPLNDVVTPSTSNISRKSRKNQETETTTTASTRRLRKTSTDTISNEEIIEKGKKPKQKVDRTKLTKKEDELNQIIESVVENINIPAPPPTVTNIDEKPKRRRKQNIKDLIRDENKLTNYVETSSSSSSTQVNVPNEVDVVVVQQKEKKSRGRPAKNKSKPIRNKDDSEEDDRPLKSRVTDKKPESSRKVSPTRRHKNNEASFLEEGPSNFAKTTSTTTTKQRKTDDARPSSSSSYKKKLEQFKFDFSLIQIPPVAKKSILKTPSPEIKPKKAVQFDLEVLDKDEEQRQRPQMFSRSNYRKNRCKPRTILSPRKKQIVTETEDIVVPPSTSTTTTSTVTPSTTTSSSSFTFVRRTELDEHVKSTRIADYVNPEKMNAGMDIVKPPVERTHSFCAHPKKIYSRKAQLRFFEMQEQPETTTTTTTVTTQDKPEIIEEIPKVISEPKGIEVVSVNEAITVNETIATPEIEHQPNVIEEEQDPLKITEPEAETCDKVNVEDVPLDLSFTEEKPRIVMEILEAVVSETEIFTTEEVVTLTDEEIGYTEETVVVTEESGLILEETTAVEQNIIIPEEGQTIIKQIEEPKALVVEENIVTEETQVIPEEVETNIEIPENTCNAFDVQFGKIDENITIVPCTNPPGNKIFENQFESNFDEGSNSALVIDTVTTETETPEPLINMTEVVETIKNQTSGNKFLTELLTGVISTLDIDLEVVPFAEDDEYAEEYLQIKVEPHKISIPITVTKQTVNTCITFKGDFGQVEEVQAKETIDDSNFKSFKEHECKRELVQIHCPLQMNENSAMFNTAEEFVADTPIECQATESIVFHVSSTQNKVESEENLNLLAELASERNKTVNNNNSISSDGIDLLMAPKSQLQLQYDIGGAHVLIQNQQRTFGTNMKTQNTIQIMTNRMDVKNGAVVRKNGETNSIHNLLNELEDVINEAEQRPRVQKESNTNVNTNTATTPSEEVTNSIYRIDIPLNTAELQLMPDLDDDYIIQPKIDNPPVFDTLIKSPPKVDYSKIESLVGSTTTTATTSDDNNKVEPPKLEKIEKKEKQVKKAKKQPEKMSPSTLLEKYKNEVIKNAKTEVEVNKPNSYIRTTRPRRMVTVKRKIDVAVQKAEADKKFDELCRQHKEETDLLSHSETENVLKLKEETVPLNKEATEDPTLKNNIEAITEEVKQKRSKRNKNIEETQVIPENNPKLTEETKSLSKDLNELSTTTIEEVKQKRNKRNKSIQETIQSTETEILASNINEITSENVSKLKEETVPLNKEVKEDPSLKNNIEPITTTITEEVKQKRSKRTKQIEEQVQLPEIQKPSNINEATLENIPKITKNKISDETTTTTITEEVKQKRNKRTKNIEEPIQFPETQKLSNITLNCDIRRKRKSDFDERIRTDELENYPETSIRRKRNKTPNSNNLEIKKEINEKVFDELVQEYKQTLAAKTTEEEKKKKVETEDKDKVFDLLLEEHKKSLIVENCDEKEKEKEKTKQTSVESFDLVSLQGNISTQNTETLREKEKEKDTTNRIEVVQNWIDNRIETHSHSSDPETELVYETIEECTFFDELSNNSMSSPNTNTGDDQDQVVKKSETEKGFEHYQTPDSGISMTNDDDSVQKHRTPDHENLFDTTFITDNVQQEIQVTENIEITENIENNIEIATEESTEITENMEQDTSIIVRIPLEKIQDTLPFIKEKIAQSNNNKRTFEAEVEPETESYDMEHITKRNKLDEIEDEEVSLLTEEIHHQHQQERVPIKSKAARKAFPTLLSLPDTFSSPYPSEISITEETDYLVEGIDLCNDIPCYESFDSFNEQESLHANITDMSVEVPPKIETKQTLQPDYCSADNQFLTLPELMNENDIMSVIIDNMNVYNSNKGMLPVNMHQVQPEMKPSHSVDEAKRNEFEDYEEEHAIRGFVDGICNDSKLFPEQTNVSLDDDEDESIKQQTNEIQVSLYNQETKEVEVLITNIPNSFLYDDGDGPLQMEVSTIPVEEEEEEEPITTVTETITTNLADCQVNPVTAVFDSVTQGMSSDLLQNSNENVVPVDTVEPIVVDKPNFIVKQDTHTNNKRRNKHEIIATTSSSTSSTAGSPVIQTLNLHSKMNLSKTQETASLPHHYNHHQQQQQHQTHHHHHQSRAQYKPGIHHHKPPPPSQPNQPNQPNQKPPRPERRNSEPKTYHNNHHHHQGHHQSQPKTNYYPKTTPHIKSHKYFQDFICPPILEHLNGTDTNRRHNNSSSSSLEFYPQNQSQTHHRLTPSSTTPPTSNHHHHNHHRSSSDDSRHRNQLQHLLKEFEAINNKCAKKH